MCACTYAHERARVYVTVCVCGTRHSLPTTQPAPDRGPSLAAGRLIHQYLLPSSSLPWTINACCLAPRAGQFLLIREISEILVLHCFALFEFLVCIRFCIFGKSCFAFGTFRKFRKIPKVSEDSETFGTFRHFRNLPKFSERFSERF